MTIERTNAVKAGIVAVIYVRSLLFNVGFYEYDKS